MHRLSHVQLAVLLALTASVARAVPPPPEPPAGVRSLDLLSFADDQAAGRAWRASTTVDAAGARVAAQSTAPVAALNLGGRAVVRFPCNFAGTTSPRAYWDREVACDLTRATAVVFDVYAENLRAIGRANLYLRTGEGWYGASWYPKDEGAWCRVRLPKGEFTVDQPGAGWSQISGLRLSPWVGTREDAVLYLANLGLEESDGSVVILTQEYQNGPAEQRQSTGYSATVAALLESVGLPLPTISTLELSAAQLQGVRLVILPYAGQMSPATAGILTEYLRAGGRLLACFSLPSALAGLLGVRQSGYRQQAVPGEFSSIRPSDAADGLPDAVGQRSWAVIGSQPVDGVGTVAAWWHDQSGRRTDAPAVIVSPRGAWFSHVFLKDDPAAKGALLLALAGRLVPELRGEVCARRLSALGADVSEAGWSEACRRVADLADYRRSAAPATLKEATAAADEARRALAAGDWTAAGAAADRADERLRTAWCQAQRAQAREFRAAWCHPREGISGWGWDKTAARLAQAGIDHLFLNVLHGASTSYPSRYAPFDQGDAEGRDYLTEAVAACARQGIKVHVWITNYRLHGHTPDDQLRRLRAEGRLQSDRRGAEELDLCPANEANVQLQKDLMVEAACWPGVAGVHFDYIRYPNHETCYCATCRRLFEQRVGHALGSWPADVLSGTPLNQHWLQFRRDQITRLVREVHDEVRRRAPNCRISAAVFRDYGSCGDSVGQDWPLWVRQGWLDFVCPMNYTASPAEFRNSTAGQLQVVAGKIPCYPGIGLLEGLGPVGAVRQIQITRDLGAGGFVVWSVYPEYIDSVFPYLGLGILTARGAP